MRVWASADGTETGTIRGIAVHVRSGRQRPFVGPADLVEFIRDATGRAQLDGPTPHRG